MTKSCGAVLFRNNNKIIEYLVLRAYSHWDFPKGIMEKEDDNPVETAKREVEEETSLKSITFVVKDEEKIFYETKPYGKNGKIARYYLCLVPFEESKKMFLPVSAELGKPEHNGFQWIPSKEVKKLVNDRILKVIEWADKQLKDAGIQTT